MKERYSGRDGEMVPSKPEIDAFIAEIIGVCERHGLSIDQEYSYGGFKICKFNSVFIKRLSEAEDSTDE